MTQTEGTLITIVTICAGLSAGVFFAFSTFVMPALNKLRAPEAIRAMQEINRAAPNGPFMLVLFGPLIPLAWLVIALIRRSSGATAYVAVGTACFVAGLLVLMGYHVPHNNALDKIDSTGSGAGKSWRDYYGGWTAWNHVRTLAFTAATALFTLALRTD
jgi:uncharacterized membrane protein